MCLGSTPQVFSSAGGSSMSGGVPSEHQSGVSSSSSSSAQYEKRTRRRSGGGNRDRDRDRDDNEDEYNRYECGSNSYVLAWNSVAKQGIQVEESSTMG